MDIVKAYTDLVRTNYTAYVHYVHEGRWVVSKAGKYITSEVQKFIEEDTGHAFDILILSMPPQHGKSMSVTETLPSYYLGRYPENRIIEISYSEDFAQLFGRRNKQKIKDFGSLFGISLASYPNSATEFELDNNVGGMISRGVGSGVTGRPANLMIIDDPIKNRQEASSEVTRNAVWNEWLNSFRSRLAVGAKVIVIMTRWHEDDLAGRMIQYEKNVKVINLPCEAEDDDPLGRERGEALMPEIGKDDEWLIDFKKGYMSKEGSMTWNALYQGHPSAMEGNLIKREWWQYYRTLPECYSWVMSVDAAFKDGDSNDFVAIQVWAKSGKDIYLVDALKSHLDFVGTVEAIQSFKHRYPSISAVLIEDKANGSAIIQTLRSSMQGIIPINPVGGKYSRASAVTPLIESGCVFLPEFSSFTVDFIDECASFPNAAHDDQVDAMTQALHRFKDFRADAPQSSKIEGSFSKYFRKKKNAVGKGEKINVI